MGGRGVYFTTISPGKKIDGASWPSVKFREDLLKSNYGDDWNNLSRQQLVDAVIVCFVDQGICVPVPPRLRGRLCPERCRSAERISVCGIARPKPPMHSCASFKTQVPGREQARVVRPEHLHNASVFVVYRAVQLYAAKLTYS